jgi:hypothetical protein
MKRSNPSVTLFNRVLIRVFFAVLVLGILPLMGCQTLFKRFSKEESSSSMKKDLAAASAVAKGAVINMEELQQRVDTGNIFEEGGDPPKIPTIGIIRPSGSNLADGEEWLLDVVKSALNNSFRKFAAGRIGVMNLTDEAALEAEVTKSLTSGSQENELSLSARQAARALMTGTVIKMQETRFSLEFTVTDTQTHDILATYSGNHSDIELTEGMAINKVTENLLGQLGVRLNEAGKQALLGNSIEAETALAKGRAAEQSGNSLQAMNYLFNAASYNATASEAAGSLVAVQNRNQRELGAGAIVADFFERQELWQGRLNEFNSFYKDHPPFELYYTPPNPTNMRGSGDSRAYDLHFRIGLRWSQTQIAVMERVLSEYILDGLNKNSADELKRWELKGLPDDSILFQGPGNFNYQLQIDVENERGEVIVSGPLVLSGSLYRYGGSIYADCTQEFSASFPGIPYQRDQITNQLYVRVASINGVDIKTVGENGFMRVAQSQSLPAVQGNSLPRDLLAAKQREIDDVARQEREAAARVVRQEQEVAKTAEKERKKQEAASNSLQNLRIGTVVTGGPILGTDAWTINLDMFMGIKHIDFDVGIMFYPNIQKDHLLEREGNSEYTTDDLSVLGVNLGLGYTLVGRFLLLSAGAGATLFTSSVDSESDRGDIFANPYLQIHMDWHLVSLLYLRAGYRFEMYPADKFYLYFQSDTKKSVGDFKFTDNVFLGLVLML